MKGISCSCRECYGNVGKCLVSETCCGTFRGLRPCFGHSKAPCHSTCASGVEDGGIQTPLSHSKSGTKWHKGCDKRLSPNSRNKAKSLIIWCTNNASQNLRSWPSRPLPATMCKGWGTIKIWQNGMMPGLCGRSAIAQGC